MATSKKTTKADEPQTTAEFYPEDAQERNFDAARETARVNHEKDMRTRSIGATDADYVAKTDAVEVINPAAAPAGDTSDAAPSGETTEGTGTTKGE